MNNAQFVPTLTERVLHALLFTPTPDGWCPPVFIWGPPGVGKTKLNAAIADRYDWGGGKGYVRLSPAEGGEGQFGVVPVPDKTERGMRLAYPAPAWVDDLPDGGVLNLDEFNLGGYALQAPMLGLVQLGIIGQHKLSGRVRRIACANQAHDAPGAVETANSVNNRFAHFTYEGLAPDAWGQGLLTRFQFGARGTRKIDAKAEEDRVMKAFEGWAYNKAAALVSAFTARRPDLLQCKPAKGQRGVLAWPSKRTWEVATYALAGAFIHELDESETDAVLSSILGHDAVVEFNTWRATLDLPDVVEVLDGKVTWEHDPSRPDRTDVVLRTIGGHLHDLAPDNPRRVPRAECAWSLVGAVFDQAADLAIPAAQLLFRAGLTFPRLKSPVARKFQAKIKPVLDAAKAAVQAAGIAS